MALEIFCLPVLPEEREELNTSGKLRFLLYTIKINSGTPWRPNYGLCSQHGPFYLWLMEEEILMLLITRITSLSIIS